MSLAEIQVIVDVAGQVSGQGVLLLLGINGLFYQEDYIENCQYKRQSAETIISKVSPMLKDLW